MNLLLIRILLFVMFITVSLGAALHKDAITCEVYKEKMSCDKTISNSHVFCGVDVSRIDRKDVSISRSCVESLDLKRPLDDNCPYAFEQNKYWRRCYKLCFKDCPAVYHLRNLSKTSKVATNLSTVDSISPKPSSTPWTQKIAESATMSDLVRPEDITTPLRISPSSNPGVNQIRNSSTASGSRLTKVSTASKNTSTLLSRQNTPPVEVSSPVYKGGPRASSSNVSIEISIAEKLIFTNYLIITVILTALFFTTLAIVTVFCITRLLHRPKDQTQHPQLHQLNHTPPSHQSQLQTCLTLELNGTGSPSPLTPDQSGISEVDSCNPAERDLEHNLD
ncbi:uncharacterized protein LOC142342368 isoform X2 [Convolutriloba macropyga]|uniref:uncharacterized protein LOC142342368 isoform X2 n=1 Tax=Convolutriloba macropyga TaxID=536237 RepID=UPI003F5271FA